MQGPGGVVAFHLEQAHARLHYHGIRSPFSILYHGTCMCPLPGASELLDRRHPNFRDFRSKAVLWQEKPSASLCKTPMNFRAAKLEGSILWRSLWLCDMLHIFHHLACPRNGSNWRLKSVSGMRRNSGRFTAGVFRARALQHLTFHHCIRSDTHARAHTHRLPGCSRLSFPDCFQVACHAFPSVFRFLAWEMCIQSGRFELAYSFCMLTRTRVSKFPSDCWHASHFRFLQIPAHNVVRFVTLELGFQSVRFEFVSCEDWAISRGNWIRVKKSFRLVPGSFQQRFRLVFGHF